MRRRRASLLLGVALATGAGAREPDPPAAIAVVVGHTSPRADVTVDTLRELYLRRQRLWPDGTRAIAVNLPADDPLRREFSRRVLGRQPRALRGYWNARYFEGIRPPLVLRSPRAVCAYVESEPGAIGYVPATEVTPRRCRVLMVLDGSG